MVHNKRDGFEKWDIQDMYESQMVMAYTFNPRTWEVETDKSLWVYGHVGLYNEFQDSQGLKKKEEKIRVCIKRLSPPSFHKV